MADKKIESSKLQLILRVSCIYALDFVINISWSIVSMIIFTAIYQYSNGIYLDGNEMLNKMVSSPEFLFISCMYNIFVIAMTFLFWKYIDKQNTEIIGLRWKENSLKLFRLGLLGGALEIVLIMLLSLGMGTLWFEAYGFKVFSTTEVQRSLFWGIPAFLLVGFGEESIYRGYIQKRLMLSIGNKRALLISSFIFMTAHIFTYGKILDFIDVALGGIILGYLYILTDSLYLTAAYHFIYDYLQVNIIKLQDYEHFKGAVLYIFENTGEVIISGQNFGNVIEVSFIIAEAIVLLMLYLFRNRISIWSMVGGEKTN